MNFAIQIGFSAAVAGIAWFTKKRVTEPSACWEGRIAFYDYTESERKQIEDILRIDNGKIMSLKILNKTASGCMNTAFANVIPKNHLVLVLKTDRDEYWSIEKNDKAIHIQKTLKEYDVLRKLDGNVRDTPILHDLSRQDYYLNIWKIHYFEPYDITKRSFNINDIIVFVIKKELPIKFSYLENCQIFLKRVLHFMFNGIKSSLTFYNYSIKQLLASEEFLKYCKQDVLISEVKWLYNGFRINNRFNMDRIQEPRFVGFLVKANNGQFYSFEQDFNCIHIQQSEREDMLLKYLNGELRKSFLKPGNEGFERSFGASTKQARIKTIFQTLKTTRQIFNDRQELIEESLQSIYVPRFEMSSGFTFYDYFELRSMDIVSTAINLPTSYMVSEISLWNKLAIHEDDSKSALLSNCMVMIIKTSNHEYWSLERDNNITHVQRSSDEEDLLRCLDSVTRRRQLEALSFGEDNKKRLRMCGILEFIIEFHRKFEGSQRENIINRTLQYFRYI